MMKYIFLLILTSLLFSCSTIEVINKGNVAESLIIIDGEAGEWRKYITQYEDEDIYFASENYNGYLYFVLIIQDQEIAKSALFRGLQFSFNNSDEDIRINFPRPKKSKNSNKLLDDLIDNLRSENFVMFLNGKKEVAFFDDDFEIKAEYFNSRLIYELKIPLTNSKLWKEDLADLSPIRFNIGFPKFDKKNRNKFGADDFGGDQGSFGSTPDRYGRAGRSNFAGGRPKGKMGAKRNNFKFELNFIIKLKQ